MRLPRSTTLLLLALACLPAWCGEAPAGGEVLACEGSPAGLGAADFACPLQATAAPQALLFSARFAGVHDDSQAGMVALLDGAPLACLDGSTPRIQGDEGGSSLVCRLQVAGDSASPARKLLLRMVWYHAFPVQAELRRE